MKLAWATDIHLNFCAPDVRAAFYRTLGASRADALLVTGDIAEATSLEDLLLEMAQGVGLPVYYLLGNHDFYGSGISDVRERARQLRRRDARLVWLPDAGILSFGTASALLGHDGWADGRFGDWWGSRVVLNDYLYIRDLADARFDRVELLRKIQALASEAAAYLGELLPRALERHRHALVATHVPPFREACWHEGEISGDDWLPHFSSKVLGDVLVAAAVAHPGCTITVACGHTHGGGVVTVRPNLTVITGGAEYGQPRLQRVFELA